MKEMKQQTHVHKFKKHTHKSGTAVFFCALPDCNKKINPALALGKRCICWKCGNEFILTEYSIRLVKPHCEACHVPKIKGERGESRETLSEVIKEQPELSILDKLNAVLRKKQEEQKEDEVEI